MSSPLAPKSGSPGYVPDLGDVVFLDFSPTRGSEMDKRRPALVLTPGRYNGLVGRCFACPVTSRGRGYPYEVALPGVKVQGFVMADQGRPVDWRVRSAQFVERAPQDVLDDVKAKLKAFLQV